MPAPLSRKSPNRAWHQEGTVAGTSAHLCRDSLDIPMSDDPDMNLPASDSEKGHALERVRALEFSFCYPDRKDAAWEHKQ